MFNKKLVVLFCKHVESGVFEEGFVRGRFRGVWPAGEWGEWGGTTVTLYVIDCHIGFN